METCSIDNCKRPKRCNSPVPCCKMHRKRWDRKKNFEKTWYKPYVNNKGYVRITPHKGAKRIFFHRYLMEKILKRHLQPKEKIHHKNGNRQDNEIKNLKIVTQSEHMKKYHRKKPIINWSKIKVLKKTTHWKPNPIKNCLIESCQIKAKKRGLCNKHYVSYWKNYLSK